MNVAVKMLNNFHLPSGSDPSAQGAVSVAVPRAAGVLRRAVPGEGRHPDGAGHQGAAQVLAKDLLPEGGESVPQWGLKIIL